MPIYFMTTPAGPRLLEAKNEAQAIKHVAETTITAKPCSAKDVAVHMGAGLQLEIVVSAGESKPAASAAQPSAI